MFDYARQRAIDFLRPTRRAVLATSGPAGVQAGEFLCQADGLALYLLVPRGSDHLFNLENNPEVSLLAAGWALNGEAHVIDAGAGSLDPAVQGCRLVRVEPRKIHIHREGGWGTSETIDLKPV